MNSKYSEIEKQIEDIFVSIKLADSVESSEPFFSLLEPLQFELAKTLFKDKVVIPEKLEKFVRDFDRSDDKDLRSRMFKEIKVGNYSF